MMPRLYAITDQTLMPAEQFEQQAYQAIANGIAMLQYRDKSSDRAKRLKQALFLRQCCTEFKVPLIINDDIELAERVAADGVHLGLEDASIASAREQLGPDAIIGVSCYDQLTLADQAVAQGASYIAFGRCFPSKTKPQAVQVSFDILTQAKQRFALPVVAIGGINQSNIQQLPLQSIDQIAIVDGIFGQPDIAQATQQLCDELNGNRSLK